MWRGNVFYGIKATKPIAICMETGTIVNRVIIHRKRKITVLGWQFTIIDYDMEQYLFKII